MVGFSCSFVRGASVLLLLFGGRRDGVVCGVSVGGIS